MAGQRGRLALRALPGLAVVGAIAALFASSAGAAPLSFLHIDGNIRNTSTTPYDWGNSGTAFGQCENGGIDAYDSTSPTPQEPGTGGIFNCGKAGTPSATDTNPLPIAPTLTAAAAADTSIVSPTFIVDGLYNSTSKNTDIPCPNTSPATFTSSGDPTSFTSPGSDKNDLPIGGFTYGPGSLQPKDNLGNVYAFAHVTPGVDEAYFGAERVVNNGASHIDFEFLQSQVALVPSSSTSCSGTFTGHRTGGDFLVAVDFTTGGSLGSVTIYEWACGGTTGTIDPGLQCDPGKGSSAQYVNVTASVPPSAINVAVNAGTSPILCGGWVCRGEEPGDDVNHVSTNEFMEGGIDLTAIGFTGCVSTLLPHTRSSPDIDSTLSDFAGPVGFNTCNITTSTSVNSAAGTSGGIGSSLTDSATVTGFTGSPGSVSFNLYKFPAGTPVSSTSCDSTSLVTSYSPNSGTLGAHSTGTATFTTSAAYTAISPGLYEWVASYFSPGATTPAVSSVCGAEPVAITGQDLTVNVTANTRLTRTYTWTISKAVDKTTVEIAKGGIATFNYTVVASETGSTDSNWSQTGVITVTNPNAVAFTGVSVTDSNDDGGTCTVTGGSSATVPASGSATFNYSCSYTSAPSPYTGTNTGTASWTQSTYGTPDSSASGTHSFNFSTGTINPVDDSVTVTDTFGGTLGSCSESAAPCTFTYSKTQSGVAGTCTNYNNTATFTTDTTKTTGSASKTVTVCVGEDLTVTKTATATFTRTYNWGISKSVDKTTVDIAQGGTATFDYTVVASVASTTDSAWAATGTITVSNPNDWEAITANVTDAVQYGTTPTTDPNATCTVTNGTGAVVPKSGSVALDYSCTWSAAPAATSETNDATASWDKSTFFTPDGSADGTAALSFATPTTIVDDSVTVTDTFGGTLGSCSESAAPCTFTYSKTQSGVAGTCTNYNNTAAFTTDTTKTTGSASKTVTVCVGEDLTVTKTATPTFTRTYNWGISKSVTPTSQSGPAGGTSSPFNYTVTVSETGFADSGWQATGTITVSNPNDWEAITASSITDAITGDSSALCNVSGGSNVAIPALESTTLSYSCTWSGAPASTSETNVATANWDATTYSTADGSATGSAAVNFTTPTATVDKTVTVTDTVGGSLGTCTATDTMPFKSCTFTYTHSFTFPAAGTCQTYPNTATIVETDQTASASVKVCGLTTSEIAPTTTTCSEFMASPSGNTLYETEYKASGGTISTVTPGVFWYYVEVTGYTNGTNSFTINQTAADSYAGRFFTGSGSAVYTSAGCASNSALKTFSFPSGTSSPTVSFSGTSGTAYFIGIKYSATSIEGNSVPTGSCTETDPTDPGTVSSCATFSLTTTSSANLSPGYGTSSIILEPKDGDV